jgi:hypothetical protein
MKRDRLGDLDLDGWILLKEILKEDCLRKSVDWIQLAQDRVSGKLL